ncbi:MAG: Asp23/Gls24 family envelope stress response protein [Clostridia bacterium]|nr:Asp23/Gls24 family envelope stress response protein [Clostridia bacterium]
MDEKINGTIKISEEVIASIATTAAMEIEGVYKVNQKISPSVKNISAQLKHIVKGVNIINSEDGVDVTLQITIKHGYNIPDVAQKVQKNISEALSGMTGFAIKRVNVIVTSVVEEKTKTK